MELGENIELGATFSRNYRRPKSLLNDSNRFRVKIAHVIFELSEECWVNLENHLAKDVGLSIGANNLYSFRDWFIDSDIVDVLDAITSISRFFEGSTPVPVRRRYLTGPDVAAYWRQKVSDAFVIEALGYRLDKAGGVHFFVDSEFESVRGATVAGLGSSRYANVAHSLEKAYAFLDGPVIDTKSAARSAFESLEILVKLIVPEAHNLNKGMIEQKLKPVVLQFCVDETHGKMVAAIMDSLKDFVDGMHNYRHGQGQESVVEPPLDVSIYMVSQVSNAIRLLIPVDQRVQSGS